MKKVWLGLKFFYGCLVVIRNPLKTDIIIGVARALAKPQLFQETLRIAKSTPEGRKILEEKLPFPKLDLDQLALLPENTLGYKYASYMKSNNLDPDFYKVTYHDEATYMFYRYGQVHDLWHVLIGFDISIEGELGMMGYTYAQANGQAAILIVALTFLHGVFFKPLDLKNYVESFVTGWELGRKTKRLFAIDWQTQMARPYDDVRQDLNFIESRAG